jgi:Golgi phosphoprotein 3 (GPP34)
VSIGHTERVDLRTGVAIRLVQLCRAPDGTVLHDDSIDIAVRGAILTDLALIGRLTDGDDGLGVDPAPTGFAPADRLLAGIVAHPDHTLEWWLRRGSVGQHDLIDELLASHRWTLAHAAVLPSHRRYEVVGTPGAAVHSTGGSRSARAIARADRDQPTAALALLAQAIGIATTSISSAALLATCGDAAWIVDASLHHLRNAQALRLASAADARSWQNANFIF